MVISFHTGEDRLVKQTFRALAQPALAGAREARRRERYGAPVTATGGDAGSDVSSAALAGGGGVDPTALAAPAKAGVPYAYAVPVEYRKPLTPTAAEVAANPRSRSAKLRVLQRL